MIKLKEELVKVSWNDLPYFIFLLARAKAADFLKSVTARAYHCVPSV